MHEPITIVKLREARTIKVPAGGWVLVGNPDMPLHEQLAKHNALIKKGNVSDEYSAILIGHFQDVLSPVTFMTQKEADGAIQRQKEVDESMKKSHSDALQRQKDATASDEEKRKKEHAVQLEKINKQNDAIRNRDAHVTPPTMDIEDHPSSSEPPES